MPVIGSITSVNAPLAQIMQGNLQTVRRERQLKRRKQERLDEGKEKIQRYIPVRSPFTRRFGAGGRSVFDRRMYTPALVRKRNRAKGRYVDITV